MTKPEEALRETTAYATAEHLLRGVVNMLTNPRTPATMWVHGALSCGDEPLQTEFDAQRAAGQAILRKRFERAVLEGDLPKGADADALALFIQTVDFGLTEQASTGATPQTVAVRRRERAARLADVLWRAFTRSEELKRSSEICPRREQNQLNGRHKVKSPRAEVSFGAGSRRRSAHQIIDAIIKRGVKKDSTGMSHALNSARFFTSIE